MPDLTRTIPTIVQQAADRFGDRQALLDGEIDLSFAELAREVHRAARALIANGVAPGNRVAIWAPNLAEWAIAALGTHAAGGAVVPINTRFKGSEAGYLLERSGADLLFTVSDFLDIDYVSLLTEAHGGALPTGLNQVVILRGAVPDGAKSFAEFLADGDSVDTDVVAERSAAIDPESVANILFTSGTTGRPKGAMLSHGATVRAFEDWATVVGLTEGDRYLIVNPFFHSFGLNAGILACLLKGATMLPHPVFDVAQVMARVPADGVTMLPGPPAIYQTILNHPDLASFDMSSLRLSVTGAAAIPVQLIIDMREKLGFENIVTGYGLTEATGIATMCRHDDDPTTIATTSGRAIPDVEVMVVDDDGNEMERGTPGEILIRGYNVMLGYLDDPEATAQAIDADGWLHSGDIGVMDSAGNIDITDRKKDMYIRGGENVYPAEVETAMSEHPDIAQVAVVGIADQRMGEVGMAFVIAASDTSPDPEALRTWCREKMANYKVPSRIAIVDSLPLNASGKVLKYELRESVTEA